MSKARQLANMLSNSADLSDGASTGGEFKFQASGAIAANKPLQLKADSTVEQIKFSSATNLTEVTTPTEILYMPWADNYVLLDLLYDNNKLFVLYHHGLESPADRQLYLRMYTVNADRTLTFNSSTYIDQRHNAVLPRRAYISKTAGTIYTDNKIVVTLFDSDESYQDGGIAFYAFEYTSTNLIYAGFVFMGDDIYLPYPKAMFRPIQVGDYIISAMSTNSSTNVSIYAVRTDIASGATRIQAVDNDKQGNITGTVEQGDPHQRIIVKTSDTSYKLVKSDAAGNIDYSDVALSTSGVSTWAGTGGRIPSGASVADGTYDEFDMVWSDTLNYFLLLTNNNTKTRIAILDSSFNLVHARDYYSVGRNDEFYRSLQVDENTGRFYFYTGNNATDQFNLITGTVSDDKVYFFEDETIVHSFLQSNPSAILRLNSATGEFVYGCQALSTSYPNLHIGFASIGTAASSNFVSGSFIGYSKEPVSNGEYVTTAINGGVVSLPDLTKDTTYFIEAGGNLSTTGVDADCVGKTFTPTDLRIDTEASEISDVKTTNDVTTLGTSEASKVVTADANGDVILSAELKSTSYNETYAAVTSTTNATTVDCETGNSFSHTLTENTTFTFSNPPASGTAYTFSLEIIQDASASGFTVTWPASVDWPAATAPTLTATASAKDIFVFTSRDGGTNWYGFTAGQALG